MLATHDIYLDVETDWTRRLTVVGFLSEATGLVQLVGPEITADRLRAALPPAGTLFTYNGHCFDLPCLRKQLDLDLRACFASVDLMYACRRHRLRGGQKAVERHLGLVRKLPHLDGRAAIDLWHRHQRGEAGALVTLLRYNAEDLHGLRFIRGHLDRLGSPRSL